MAQVRGYENGQYAPTHIHAHTPLHALPHTHTLSLTHTNTKRFKFTEVKPTTKNEKDMSQNCKLNKFEEHLHQKKYLKKKTSLDWKGSQRNI